MARQLVVEILSDAKKFDKGFDKAERRMGQFDGKTKQASTTTAKFGGQVDAARTSLINMGKVAAGGAVLAFLKSSSDAASALNESINAVNSVFGDASDTVTEFGKISAQVTGLSAREFNQLATQTGALLTNMGFSMQEAGDESIRLATRAADLASIFDTDVATALNAVNAGLRGETEPLRRFGVTLSDAAVRAKAVELGLSETTAAVDANGKAVAALELIYEQTASAQGDFIETSGEVANAQRVLEAQFENTQAAFGQSSLGAKSFFLSAGSDLLAGLNLLGIFGGAARDAQREAIRFEDALFAITEAVKDGGQPLDRLADSLAFLATEGDLTTAQFEALALAAGLSRDQFADFGRIVLEQGRAMGLSEEVLAELEAAIIGTGDAAEEATPAIEDMGHASEVVAGQLADAAAAQAEFNELLDVFGTDGAPNASRWLEEIGLAAFNSVDDVLRIKAAMEGAAFAAAELAGAPIFSGGAPRGGGGATPRAHGGPVRAGEMYQVGEGNKPELMFIPGNSGQMFSNADSSALIAALKGGGGGDQNVYVTVADASTAVHVASLFRQNHALTRGGLRGGAR